MPVLVFVLHHCRVVMQVVVWWSPAQRRHMFRWFENCGRFSFLFGCSLGSPGWCVYWLLCGLLAHLSDGCPLVLHLEQYGILVTYLVAVEAKMSILLPWLLFAVFCLAAICRF